MPNFSFSIPLGGTADYNVEAATLEEACALLASETEENGEGIDNKFLIQHDPEWSLSNWFSRNSLAKDLEEYGEER